MKKRMVSKREWAVPRASFWRLFDGLGHTPCGPLGFRGFTYPGYYTVVPSAPSPGCITLWRGGGRHETAIRVSYVLYHQQTLVCR